MTQNLLLVPHYSCAKNAAANGFRFLADELGRDDQFERSLYYMAFGTEDKQEGVKAFMEKRTAVWRRS
jgi:hypothetical protein